MLGRSRAREVWDAVNHAEALVAKQNDKRVDTLGCGVLGRHSFDKGKAVAEAGRGHARAQLRVSDVALKKNDI